MTVINKLTVIKINWKFNFHNYFDFMKKFSKIEEKLRFFKIFLVLNENYSEIYSENK